MRAWWLRVVLVLQSPRAVFVALRNDDPEDIAFRSEPVLLIVLLSGIAYVLSTRTAAHLMDDHDYDNVLVAVWAFLSGGLYGGVVYYLVGGILHWSVTLFGSEGSYRRSRQLLAFASVPIVLSLVLWPVKLAVYGDQLFRTGGADAGHGAIPFTVAWYLFAVWSAVLLVIGVRAVHGWSWRRAAAAGGVVPLVLALAFVAL